MDYKFKSKLRVLKTFWDRSGITSNAGISDNN